MITCKEIEDYIRYCDQHPAWINRDRRLLIENVVKPTLRREDVYLDEKRFSTCLRYCEGNYYPLFPYQKFILAFVFIYYVAGGNPLFPEIIIMMGRGNGKDGLMAPLANFLQTPLHGIKNYHIELVANSEKQIKDTFKIPHDMIDGNPKFKGKFKVTLESIINLQTGSELRFNASNSKTADGKRPGCVFFNEIHGYENYDNINVYESSEGKVEHFREIFITTNGYVRGGPLDDMLESCREILKTGENPLGRFPFLCSLDDEKEIGDREAWHKANPSLEYMPKLQTALERGYIKAKENPQQRSEFKTKRMNLPDSGEEAKVTDYENIRITNRELPDMEGWNCVVGIDFSKVTDWVSVDLHFKQGDQRYDISHSWMCLESSDIPRLRVPWRDWAKAGRLTLVDDVEIHPEVITDYIQEAKSRYYIRAAAIDDFRYALLARSLDAIGFDPKEKKNLKLVRFTDIMRIVPIIDSCFANRRFTWGDAPELRWATNNTKLIRYGRKIGQAGDADVGNYVYGKIEAKSRKTDPFMALVAAMTVEDRIIERRTQKRRLLDIVTG